MEMNERLGVLGELWDAWVAQPPQSDEYYAEALRHQIKEIEEITKRGVGRVAATNEMVDIISLALDWMRANKVRKEEITEVIRWRIEGRYRGRQAEIIQAYRARMESKYYPQDGWKNE
ncbi:MAG: hypothetical protein HY459_02820 [Parcubacteria group bacterium]|nr:hypothetical protein [Parcubacteria group bacterium]